LEAQIEQQKRQIEELVRANEELKTKNSTLTDANCQLKEQMQYYAPYIGQMSDMVEQYKLSILKKISPRDNQTNVSEQSFNEVTFDAIKDPAEFLTS
jgi:cell division protein FtsB